MPGIATTIMVLGCVVMMIRAKQKGNTDALISWIVTSIMYAAYYLK